MSPTGWKMRRGLRGSRNGTRGMQSIPWHSPTSKKFCRTPSRGLGSGCRGFLGCLEIDFVLNGLLGPSGAQQNAAATLHHSGMTTKIGRSVFRRKPPKVHVLADEIVHAASFAMPLGVFPGTADGRHVLQPGRLGGVLLQLIAITKFPGSARSLNAKEPMLTRHRSTALFPVRSNGADVADIGRNSGDGSQEKVVLAATAEVQGETPFGESAKKERSALVHRIEERGEFAVVDAFHEELQDIFVRRGAQRVGAFDALVLHFDAQSGVLAGEIGERAAGVHMKQEKIIGDDTAVKDFGGQEFF